MPFYDDPLVGKLAVQPGEPTVAQGAAVGQLWSDSNASCGALYIVTCICGCCVTSVQKCGASTFLGLTDTPGSFSGQACKRVAVNGCANALVFVCAAGGGDFSGPASSTDNAIVRFNGTGGKTGQNSGITIDDCDNLTLAGTLTLAGSITRAADQTIDLTGAATRTLTLQNSTACQVANLDLADGALLVDTISETTAAAGVTIDGVLLKDGLICACDVPCSHAGSAHHAALTLAGSLDYLTLSGQEITRGAIVLTTDVSGTLPVGNGGTGATTLTDGGVLLGSGAGAITALGQPTNGQLVIGSTGADPVVAGLTAGCGIDVCVGAGSITINAEAASATNPGIAELATVCELNTGTDTGRVITPDVLAGSEFGTRIVGILVHCPNCCCALTTGNGKAYFRAPAEMCGWNLVDVEASVTTVSSCGLPTIQLRRDPICGCDSDMLSTRITIDASEVDSSTAATAPAIDACADCVATGMKVHVDVDVAGTGTKGLYVETHWRAP